MEHDDVVAGSSEVCSRSANRAPWSSKVPSAWTACASAADEHVKHQAHEQLSS